LFCRDVIKTRKFAKQKVFWLSFFYKMALKDDGNTISNNERDFIKQALKGGHRVDGRRPLESRTIQLSFGRAERKSSAEVQLGRTRVMAVVTAEIVPPFPDRQTDGFFQLSVELSPMASPAFEAGRPSEEAIELTRIVERGIKDSKALDTEALCIIAGEKVWSLRCSIHALDHGGNLIDAAGLAAIAALQHFRLPAVEVSGKEVSVFTSLEREPFPLSLHHIPICVTFGFFNQDTMTYIVDPTEREELVVDGRMTFSLNSHRELCAVHKIGGAPISAEQIIEVCAEPFSQI
jgi:exosome complex component RRP45